MTILTYILIIILAYFLEIMIIVKFNALSDIVILRYNILLKNNINNLTPDFYDSRMTKKYWCIMLIPLTNIFCLFYVIIIYIKYSIKLAFLKRSQNKDIRKSIKVFGIELNTMKFLNRMFDNFVNREEIIRLKNGKD